MSVKALVAATFKNRPTRGFTVSEVYSRLEQTQPLNVYFTYPTIRGRVYELVKQGVLKPTGKTRSNGYDKGQIFVSA